MAEVRALVLRAPGTNCDEETAAAWTRAGAVAETLRLTQIIDDPRLLDRFQVVTFPGGFSYGDDLGAGRIFASRIGTELSDGLRRFHERGGLLLGICNGFQVLMKAGLLPGGPGDPPSSLTNNLSARFEARWIRLLPTAGLSPFLVDDEPITLPVAHGEGRFVTSDPAALDRWIASGRVVLRYIDSENRPTEEFPANPNGSMAGVAGFCDPTGRIFGLMPHPERHIERHHHPRWTRGEGKPEGDGLRIFRNAVAALR
ncbi:MAG: phosphoribosylformylglycinamidine synthase I [Isosphaeraceae bacterium]|nr:phosphoribosylformylglycinamidine synthase I [Isosphaeraceae bacterium]